MVQDPPVPRTRASVPDARLSAAHWEVAALDALAEDGVAGVAIEPLARRLGVTKGSFYWHFADRDALLRAALRRWEDGYTEKVIPRVEALPEPRERLRRLVAGGLAGGRSDRIHIALTSARQAVVREAVARVTRRRLAYLESCYVDLGQPRRQARRSALLAYTAYVGLVHVRREAPGVLPGHAALAGYLEHLMA